MNKSHGIQKRHYSQGSFLSNVITSLCQRLQQVFTKYVPTAGQMLGEYHHLVFLQPESGTDAEPQKDLIIYKLERQILFN